MYQKPILKPGFYQKFTDSLVKKVLFPDKYIVQAIRLIKIRWLVSIFLFIALFFSWYFKVPGLHIPGLLTSAIFLAFLNAVYYVWIYRTGKKCGFSCERPAKINIVVQIVFDFLMLTTILHFSGGIENPGIVFYIFHMILSGIYLKPRNAYLITLLAVFFFLALVFTEYTGMLPHYSINKYILDLTLHEPVYLFISLGLFVITSFLAAFIAVSLSEQLRVTQKLLEKSNQSLLEKDKIKDEFVQRVTHDIKGGLAVTHSCLTVVEKQILGPLTPKNAEFVEKALNRTNKLSDFINELLTLTKMRLANRFDTSKLSVSEMINNVVQNMQSDAEKKDIKLTLTLHNVTLYMNGIKVSIEEALTNLVHNAVKYTPNEGEVRVSVKKNGEKIIIEVKDTGYGIPESDHSKIFSDFFRAGNTKDIEGTGLGLSLVKAIIERHKGTINFTSKENIGTTFTVIFDAIPA